MPRANYSAPWSKYLILVSTAVSILLIGISVVVYWSAGVPRSVETALATLPLVTLAAASLFSIRGYRLDGAQLYVRRLLWETAVDLRGLESVQRDPAAPAGSIKLFGNGGLFSVSGLFWSRKIGRYRAFLTDHTNAVVLVVGGRKILISPGDPDIFVEELSNSHPHIRIGGKHSKEAA